MTINVNSYSINIDDHKKLNQTFQWSALQTVILFESTVVLYHTIILEFDNKLINMMVAKSIYLSKKDIDQFLQLIFLITVPGAYLLVSSSIYFFYSTQNSIFLFISFATLYSKSWS